MAFKKINFTCLYRIFFIIKNCDDDLFIIYKSFFFYLIQERFIFMDVFLLLILFKWNFLLKCIFNGIFN